MSTAVKWTERQLQLFDQGKRPRPKPALEVNTHIAVADMLARLAKPGVWWSHIASGNLRTPETGRLLRRMGLRPGIPDFLIIGPTGIHYWLELKRGRAKLNPAQLEFEQLCYERFVPHAVARSFAEAEAQLRQWNVLRPEARA